MGQHTSKIQEQSEPSNDSTDSETYIGSTCIRESTNQSYIYQFQDDDETSSSVDEQNYNTLHSFIHRFFQNTQCDSINSREIEISDISDINVCLDMITPVTVCDESVIKNLYGSQKSRYLSSQISVEPEILRSKDCMQPSIQTYINAVQ